MPSNSHKSTPTTAAGVGGGSRSRAHRIGSCLFCPSCGTLLDLPGDEDEIACEQCGRREPASCEWMTIQFENDARGGNAAVDLPLPAETRVVYGSWLTFRLFLPFLLALSVRLHLFLLVASVRRRPSSLRKSRHSNPFPSLGFPLCTPRQTCARSSRFRRRCHSCKGRS